MKRNPSRSGTRSLADELAELRRLDLTALKQRWRVLYRSEPPRCISRDLLIRALGWKDADFASLAEIDPNLQTGALCDNQIDAFLMPMSHPNGAVEEAAASGIETGIHPGNGLALTGPVDRYTDAAADVQYQFIGDQHLFTVLATYIHENQRLNASFANTLASNASDSSALAR